MKATGLVLSERAYRTSVEPPDSLEDESRFGNDGVHTNITWVRLPSGLWVRSFNGASSLVDCGDEESLDITHAITIEFWMKADVVDGARGLVCLQIDATWAKLQLGLGTDTLFIYKKSIAAVHEWFYSFALSADTVYHIALTVDGKDWVAYRNGVAEDNGVFVDPLQPGIRNTWIGRNFWGGVARYHDGYIALPSIYSYALSPAQIYAHYQAERSLFGG